jgi:outer membrane protein assembly factor BamB
VGAARTTRCSSATALLVALPLIALVSVAAQDSPADNEPLSLFPIETVWTLRLNNALTAPPAFSARHVYFPIEGGRLVAYEWEVGRQAWMTTASPQLEMAVGDDLLFIAEGGALKAFRAENGMTAWERTVGALTVPPVWDYGWLIVVVAEEVMTFRAVDGELVWKRTLASKAHAQPSLAADRVYVPTDDGSVVALRVDTGDPIWERRLPGAVTGLLALEDRVYAGSRDNFFYALREGDGSIDWRWRTGADVVGIPVADDRNVYFVSMDNVLRALSRTSGVQQWARLLPLRPTRGPLVAGRTILVSGVAASLPAFNMNNGTPAGQVPAAGELAGAPIFVPDSPGSLPRILAVTRDIATGATATLFRRQLGPPLSPFAPPPNAIEVIPLQGDREDRED